MARVLLGWELGAGSGHSVRLAGVAAELRRRGHEPILAVQQTRIAPTGHEVWQAPLWPALLTSRGRARTLKPSTFGDVLMSVGLGEAGVVSGVVRAWEAILCGARPDLVIAEFAPGLLMAARGRVPALLFGTGFSAPAAGLDAFPSLTGDPPAHDERRLLATVNRELAAAGRAPLPALPAVFAADRTLVQVFPELDPYRAWRPEGDYSSPHVSMLAPVADGRGEEVFLYLNGMPGALDALVAGLVGAGLKARLYDPRLGEGEIAVLERAGIACERRPLPFARIAERSRLVVSHGGMSFTCTALCAGLPHIVVPFDLEKRLTGRALTQAGLGRAQEFRDIEPEAFARLLRDAFADDAMVAAAIAAAPGFRARIPCPSAVAAVDAVDALIG
jgi:hypothetical protein